MAETGTERVCTSAETKVVFSRLRTQYLVPTLLFRACNWLTGPYFYAVYASRPAILELPGGVTSLYLVGYVSSVTAGTLIGGCTDRCGRKWSALLCGLAFTIACLSVHSHDAGILLAGRVAGGIGATLLHSAFESWLVAEGRLRLGAADSTRLLTKIFVQQQTYTSFIAILTGLFATMLVRNFGVTAPFDAATFSVCLGSLLLSLWWTENRGRKPFRRTAADVNAQSSSCMPAASAVAGDRSLAILGLSHVAFEGSMHIFITLWPETLLSASASLHIDPGLIFSMFMVMVTVGSLMFGCVAHHSPSRHALYLALVLVVACFALAVPALNGNNYLQTLLGFLMFEVMAGAYHPCMGSLRASLIPGSVSAGVMTIFRVPQNLFVIASLLNQLANNKRAGSQDSVQQVLNTTTLFRCAVVLLVAAVAAVLQLPHGLSSKSKGD